MPSYRTISVERDRRGIATVTLDRPEARNAIDAAMIGEITDAFAALRGDGGIRGVVVRGAGKVFCAGADLHWMRDVEGHDAEQVARDSRRLQTMYRAIVDCPKPVAARIHGAAMAGGLGIVACCDVVVAHASTRFCLSEVRLGLVPGVVGPFLLSKVGPGWLRYLAMSAVTIDAPAALRAGLVHEVAEDEDDLDRRVAAHAELMLAASPDALAETKRLLAGLGAAPAAGSFAHSLQANVRARTSEAARVGIGAFLDRRPPPWAAPREPG